MTNSSYGSVAMIRSSCSGWSPRVTRQADTWAASITRKHQPVNAALEIGPLDLVGERPPFRGRGLRQPVVAVTKHNHLPCQPSPRGQHVRAPLEQTRPRIQRDDIPRLPVLERI